MAGEGFKLAMVLVIGFMVMAMASLAAVAFGRVDVNTLKELYTGMGTLAAMWSLPAIVSAYIVTRGQTSTQALPPPLYAASGTLPKGP